MKTFLQHVVIAIVLALLSWCVIYSVSFAFAGTIAYVVTGDFLHAYNGVGADLSLVLGRALNVLSVLFGSYLSFQIYEYEKEID